MATAVRKTNWFAIWVTAAVIVAIIVITALVVVMNNVAADPGETPQNASINTETGAISVGDGPNTLDTYLDFMCPICNTFEQTYGETIQDEVEAGNLTLNIHPISILDRLSQGTEYSSRAAAAMYCVANTEPDMALSYMQELFANQPPENTSGLSDEQLVEVAETAGVTDTDTVGACITDGTFKKYAQGMTAQTPIQPGQSGIATPTLVLNGETISNSTLTGDPQVDIVDKLE